ncbi:methyltransferase domain-containing protein [Aeromicrobium sp. YIM 150415]|uniref:class I SAM-dependent methyltransferase n=1 Tax=Aeromicrobium sp. YIM 150415 TaxID=2803912 RepID=UPI001965DCE8|nr:class I SAM-dependent methyltransferase [Aeromicrobium sp. YIM 150415]MBM9461934.1 methyltransferase domain-containing protein [Aeromicrobium sp. YIM 150415]
MTRQLDVTENHIRLEPSLIEGRSSVDVLISGHRVWSIDLLSTPPPADGLREWPAPLLPFLRGTAEIELVDSSSGEAFAARSVCFAGSQEPIAVVDSHGRWLAVNKWGRLGKSFAGSEEGLRDRLLDHLDDLVIFCESRKLRPFIVGGTLLGAVREGRILGHDDDADLAYLSRHTHPSDLALESFGIERELEARGIEIVRHSTAHLQLTFRTADGKVDGYVDLFTAFFREDGTINQPFHVRGEMAESSMLPFSTVTLEGRTYPAPAVPEDWLVINYDENWRTPLPGYKLRTPRATQRRFRNWFGSFNFQRDFWEERYEDVHTGARPSSQDANTARRLTKLIPPGSHVVDLGCGDGADTVWLASHGFDVTAVDYSPNALMLTRQRLDAADADATLVRANLNDLRACADLIAELTAGPRPAHVLVSHLLERLGHVGREQVLRVLRQVVRRGGTVLVRMDTLPAADVSFRDPSTWHLELPKLRRELAAVGLDAGPLSRPRAHRRDRRRRTLVFPIVPLPASSEGTSS